MNLRRLPRLLNAITAYELRIPQPARLQAFMGNDPRLRQSGQWKGQTKMTFQTALADFSLPLKGNERIPLLERTNRIRVRGEIESVSELCEVVLKNVTIELQ